MTSHEWGRPNGAAAGRHKRGGRAAALTRQQRIAISVIAAALGLLFAYFTTGRQRHRPSAAAVADLPGADGAVAQRHAAAKKITVNTKAAGKHAHSAKLNTIVSGSGQAGKAQAQQQTTKPKGDQGQSLAADAQQGQQQHQSAAQLPGMEDERHWFNQLSKESCARAEQLRVCSHRGRVDSEGVAPGSLPAYSLLHQGGVSCYDVDFVLTRDGQLVASHPEQLRAAIKESAAKAQGPQQLSQWSLAELRAAGADEERFPTADALIKVFAALLEASGQLWKGGKEGQAPDYAELPVLLMDLKGGAYNPETINSVAAAAQAVGAQAHVVLFVSDPGQLALVRNQTSWAGPLIHAYMDRQDPSPALSAEALEPFALLGPSIKMADTFFAAASQLGKPVMAWTVDSPQQLHRALEASLNAVISNRPLAVRGVLMDWRDRCSERQRRHRRRQRRRVLLRQA